MHIMYLFVDDKVIERAQFWQPADNIVSVLRDDRGAGLYFTTGWEEIDRAGLIATTGWLVIRYYTGRQVH